MNRSQRQAISVLFSLNFTLTVLTLVGFELAGLSSLFPHVMVAHVAFAFGTMVGIKIAADLS